eukprot:gene13708-557_t
MVFEKGMYDGDVSLGMNLRHGGGTQRWIDGSQVCIKNQRFQIKLQQNWGNSSATIYTPYFCTHGARLVSVIQVIVGLPFTSPCSAVIGILILNRSREEDEYGDHATSAFALVVALVSASDSPSRAYHGHIRKLMMYVGEYRLNYKHGHGILTVDDEKKHYDGEWFWNEKSGRGETNMMATDEEMKYKGEFKRNKFHGNGEKMFFDMEEFKGTFLYGLECGTGKWTFKWTCSTHTGDNWGHVQGDWVNGVLQLANKEDFVYAGHKRYGVAHGHGKLTKTKTGDVYEGDLRAGQFHGDGVMTYSDGRTYDGSWISDLQHGVGKMTYENGGSYTGQWQEGLYSGNGYLVYPSQQTIYNGQFMSGRKEGFG